MPLVTVEYAEALLAPAGLSEAQLAALPDAIEAASAAVERWCGRGFAAEDRVEVLRPDWEGVALLPSFPVRSVRRLAVGRLAAVEASCPGLGGTIYRASLSASADGLTLRTLGQLGEEQLDGLAFADHPTAGALASAIDALDDWSASLADPALAGHPSRELAGPDDEREATPGGPIVLDLFAEAIGPGDYDLDRGAGVLRIRPDAGRARSRDRAGGAEALDDFLGLGMPTPPAEVQFVGSVGFDPIPADVRAIVAEAAKTLLQGFASDSTLLEERGLNYGYKLRDAAEAAVAGLAPAALRALSTYRVHRA